MTKVAPSILSADFSRLGVDVKEVCSGGCDYLHIDVMDGLFVPNISFGASVMKSLNHVAKVPYDVHLMIENPERYIEDFITDNTEFITVHQEATLQLNSSIQMIKGCGVKAGVSLNPATPICMLENVLEYVDLVLVMSVNPGFGGQKFIGNSLEKISKLKEIKDKHGFKYDIEVDGGVTLENAEAIKAAGADILVAGSAVFKADNRAEAISKLKK